jgi:hypothetical protein
MKKLLLLSIIFLALTSTVWGAGGQFQGTMSTAASSALSTAQVTVSNTATQIVAASDSRRSLTLRNQGNVDCYIGGSTVTTGTGMLFKAGETVTFDRTTAAFYAITSSSTTIVAYLVE